MMPDVSPRAAPSALEPTASLTSVRVKRRKPPLAPSGKRGDLTDGAAAPVEPGAPVIVLPPPPVERALQQESLPFVETLLPEVMGAPEHAAPPAAAEPDPVAEFEMLELLLTDETDAPAASLDEPEPPPAVAEAAEPKPELRLVETPPPVATEPAEAAAPEPGAEPEPEASAGPDLLDYWDSLRGGRDFPALDELDRGHVGATWPNTLLLAVDAAELPRITRLGEGDGEIEYTATVIDWIMSRARSSAKRGEPMEEERRFPVSAGSARYRLLTLPLSSYGLACDHVLCQIARVPELGTVASLKRWLAW